MAKMVGIDFLNSEQRVDFDIQTVWRMLPIAERVIDFTRHKLTESNGGIYPSDLLQERVGRGGKIITVRKLTTIFEETNDANTPVIHGPNHPAAKGAAKLARLSGADEGLQLWSVLTGDMSLYGLRARLARDFPVLEAVNPQLYNRFEEIYNSVDPSVYGPGSIYGHSHPTSGSRVLEEVMRREVDFAENVTAETYRNAVYSSPLRILGANALLIARMINPSAEEELEAYQLPELYLASNDSRQALT